MARGVFVLLEHLVDVLCVAGAWIVGRRCVLCRGRVVVYLARVVMFWACGDVSLSGSGFLPGIASGLLVLCGR